MKITRIKSGYGHLQHALLIKLGELSALYTKEKGRRETVIEVMSGLFMPMLYTSLTSAVGFAFPEGVWLGAGESLVVCGTTPAVFRALTGLLAYAIWQRVADGIPYLLDPTAAPPPMRPILRTPWGAVKGRPRRTECCMGRHRAPGDSAY